MACVAGRRSLEALAGGLGQALGARARLAHHLHGARIVRAAVAQDLGGGQGLGGLCRERAPGSCIA
eukprot:1377453-Pyramimonas_sp.AAC.1